MNRFDALVSDLCTEIDYLNEKLETSEKDAARWRDAYKKLLNESISHGNVMMGHTLKAILKRCY